MKHLEHLATNVAEVDGVEGLFIMDTKGTTIASMLPAYYDGLDLNILRRRIHAFVQTFEESVFNARETLLNFGDKMLQISSSSTCIIGVVADAETNIRGIQIATRLLMKKVHAEDIREMERTAQTDTEQDGVAVRRVSGGVENPTNVQPSKPRTTPPFAKRTPSGPTPVEEPIPSKQPDTKRAPKDEAKSKFKGIWG